MDYFVGLDVSVKETSVCIVDDAGKIVREARVASEPEALLQVLTNTIYRFKRVGLEAGPLSQWLFSANTCLVISKPIVVTCIGGSFFTS
jgi:transposase